LIDVALAYGFRKVGWKSYESVDTRFALIRSKDGVWFVYDCGRLICRCWTLRDAKGIVRELYSNETYASH
jgi:hypothetical protein